jgi:hypothetical protein
VTDVFERGTADEVTAEIRRRLDDVPDFPCAPRYNALHDVIVALVAGIRARESARESLAMRIGDIADESFGLQPVSSVDTLLSIIERGIYERRVEAERFRRVYDASLELRRIESTDVPGDSIAEIEANAPAAQRRTSVALTKWRTVVDEELQKGERR